MVKKFEYCPHVWHFCSRHKTKKIETINKRYVFDNFNASYNEVLEKANTQLMYTHRMKRILSILEENVLTEMSDVPKRLTCICSQHRE